MTDKTILDFEAILDKVAAGESPDFLREALAMVAKRLMEIEVTRISGATLGERTEDRRDHRNGYRTRRWDTRVGSLELKVPRLRKTAFMPCFLNPRKRSEKALLAVIQEAYVHGVSTRKVEDLLQAMGLDGVSKSEVSRVCQELDVQVEAFRSRPLEAGYPYLWLDARYEKVRVGGRIVSNAVVVAYGVHTSGERQVLSVDVGPSESEEFWKGFLRGLVDRGLTGVKLVISDAHSGLKRALRAVLGGATWQRCRVHFMRNALAKVGKKQQPIVSATLRTIFAQPSQEEARTQLQKIAKAVERSHPRLATLLDEAGEDVTAFMGFPRTHWRQIHSTNPLERLNREIKRRTAVVGIFPNPAAVIRLVGALLVEQNEEWQVGRRYFSQSSMELLYEQPETDKEDMTLLDAELAA